MHRFLCFTVFNILSDYFTSRNPSFLVYVGKLNTEVLSLAHQFSCSSLLYLTVFKTGLWQVQQFFIVFWNICLIERGHVLHIPAIIFVICTWIYTQNITLYLSLSQVVFHVICQFLAMYISRMGYFVLLTMTTPS